jgi:Zn-finger nucleic acid-binding protein
VLHRDVRVDVCDCGGMWFDHGEVEAWARDKGDAAARTTAARTPGTSSDRVCPRCQIAAMRLHMVDGKTLNRCSRCKGVWLPARTVAALDPAFPREPTGSAWLAFLEGCLQFLSGLHLH